MLNQNLAGKKIFEKLGYETRATSIYSDAQPLTEEIGVGGHGFQEASVQSGN